eukprot:GHVR01100135.1.p1 GENE.GHVR01100135.1~~GHVR01100135.1.p1  ORF type:complete len:105 (+),score=18.35 GHVR01100135.1:25-315(+)
MRFFLFLSLLLRLTPSAYAMFTGQRRTPSAYVGQRRTPSTYPLFTVGLRRENRNNYPIASGGRGRGRGRGGGGEVGREGGEVGKKGGEVEREGEKN